MELMVVLALAAVILGIGVPEFRDFAQQPPDRRRQRCARHGHHFARRSVRRQITISMCPSAEPEDEEATCGDGAGWIVFKDPNANCEREDDEEWISGTHVDTDVNASSNTELHLLCAHRVQARRGRPADHVTHDVLR